MRKVAFLILSILLLGGPTFADERSGPERRTILREAWGTVFFNPHQVQGDFELTTNSSGDRHTFKSGQGTVQIEENEEDVKLIFPDLQANVDFEPDSLRITWGESVHSFSRSGEKMTYSGPQGELNFVRSAQKLTITGPRGVVEMKHLPQAYEVTSPVGKTRVDLLPNGFRVSGPRLVEHPYLRRGALFSHNGVGIYVELALLDPKSPLFPLLEWANLVELESTGI